MTARPPSSTSHHISTQYRPNTARSIKRDEDWVLLQGYHAIKAEEEAEEKERIAEEDLDEILRVNNNLNYQIQTEQIVQKKIENKKNQIEKYNEFEAINADVRNFRLEEAAELYYIQIMK